MVCGAVEKQKRRDAEMVCEIHGVIFGDDAMEHWFGCFPRTEQFGSESTLDFLSVA